MAARGTLAEGELFGRPIMVAGALERLGLTGDLLRLVLRPPHSPIAYAFLSTLVGRRLIRSTAVGTKILQLRFDLFRRLPFPDLAEDVRTKVQSHMELATASREGAEAAESEAIRLVEEEVLASWLA